MNYSLYFSRQRGSVNTVANAENSANRSKRSSRNCSQWINAQQSTVDNVNFSVLSWWDRGCHRRCCSCCRTRRFPSFFFWWYCSLFRSFCFCFSWLQFFSFASPSPGLLLLPRYFHPVQAWCRHIWRFEQTAKASVSVRKLAHFWRLAAVYCYCSTIWGLW